MKYIDEFRDKNLIKKIADKINRIAPRHKISIMEVCGTHTQTFRRYGLDKLLPASLKFIAGPGCPVCVSEQASIDTAIEYAKDSGVIILTFGDMLRLPGSGSTLEIERAKGASVFVVYSPWDSLRLARENPGKKVIFLCAGFETTAAPIALTILQAKKENLKNLLFYSFLKVMPPAMEYLCEARDLKIDAFLCPGHVSSIIGTKPYDFIAKRYKIGCCIAGFEPFDMLEGIYLLLRQLIKKKPRVDNQYARVVTKEGNLKAKKIISRVFGNCDAGWRGLGKIPKSGLKMREEFLRFDAERVLPVSVREAGPGNKQKKCRCADVIKGMIEPSGCPLFKKACSPLDPYGPCMVSSEGACNAYYKYDN